MNGKERRPAERKIIEILENENEDEEYRFTDLKQKTGISKPSLSKALKDLEKEEAIERYLKKGKTLITLTEEENNPREKILRHLAEVSSLPLLDVQKGRELLSDEVLEGLKDIAQHEFDDEFETEIEELNETYFLKALARYYVERFFVPAIFYTPDLMFESHKNLLQRLPEIFPKEKGGVFDFFSEGEKGVDLLEMRQFYEENVDNRGYLPALSRARELGITDQLEKLIKWIRPILEPSQAAGKDREEEVEDLIIINSSNLAASLFQTQVKTYIATVFENWYLDEKVE